MTLSRPSAGRRTSLRLDAIGVSVLASRFLSFWLRLFHWMSITLGFLSDIWPTHKLLLDCILTLPA